MGVTIGATGVGNVTLGGSPLAAIHVGTVKVWPSIPSIDINLTNMEVTYIPGETYRYIYIFGRWPDDMPDFSTITAIEIVEGPGAGTQFEISNVSSSDSYSATLYGPTLPGSVNWDLVTRLRIYYTP